MAKERKQYFGAFLGEQELTKKEIYLLTGISVERLSRLSNAKNLNLKAFEFYIISLAISADIDEMAGYIYQDFGLQINPPKNQKGKLTKLGEIAAEGLILQKTIAQVTGIAESRISTLFQNLNSIPKAFEVYMIALALKQKPSFLFDSIFGHLKLNTPKVQKELQKSYENRTKRSTQQVRKKKT